MSAIAAVRSRCRLMRGQLAQYAKRMERTQVLTVSLSERINEVPEYGRECYLVWAVKRQLAGS